MIIQKFNEKNKIKLSIIVPAYNSQETIIKCLNSIFEQKQYWIEVILVNDCSTDKTQNLVKTYKSKKKFNNLTIINSKKNIGPGKCRNLGLKISKGLFVTFLDGDDYLIKNSLKNIKRYLKNDLDLIINNTEREKKPKNNLTFFKKFKNKKYSNNNYLKKSFNNELHFNECWKVIAKRKNILNKKIYFPNFYIGEDQCFVNKLILHSKKIFLNINIFLHHTDNSKGLSSMNEQQEIFANLNIIKFLKKLRCKTKNQEKFIYQKIQILKKTISILSLNYTLGKIKKIAANYDTLLQNYLIKIYKENKIFEKKLIKNISFKNSEIYIYGKNNLSKSLKIKLKKFKIKIKYIFDDNPKFNLKSLSNYKFKNLTKKIFIISINDKNNCQIVCDKIRRLKIKDYKILKFSEIV
jgi:glycosyltransferase involved in cell wall biosynthesis